MRDAQQEALHLEKLAASNTGGIDHSMASRLSDEIENFNAVLKIMPLEIRKQAISTMNGVFDDGAADKHIPLMHMDDDGSLLVVGKDRQQDFTTLTIQSNGQVNDYERGMKIVVPR